MAALPCLARFAKEGRAVAVSGGRIAVFAAVIAGLAVRVAARQLDRETNQATRRLAANDRFRCMQPVETEQVVGAVGAVLEEGDRLVSIPVCCDRGRRSSGKHTDLRCAVIEEGDLVSIPVCCARGKGSTASTRLPFRLVVM